MSQYELDWHPVAKIIYWFLICLWIGFVLCFYIAPGSVFGFIAEAIFDRLTPKYVTFSINTFSLVGAYVLTRLLVSFRIRWKTPEAEAKGVLYVIWIAVTVMALSGARCDIYIFCAEDAFSSQGECEIDWDRQGSNCR